MRKLWIPFFCVILLLTVTLSAADVPAFETGDRVAFIGDSITHGGTYHANVYLFYATRFPDKPFKAYNCGVGSDNAPGTCIRFDSDIAVHRPNVATIMLGMNDAWSSGFGQGEPTEKMLDSRKRAYDTYTRGMDKLVASLNDLDCRLILIKPSIYDQTAQLETTNFVGKNDMLIDFGDYLETLAEKNDATIVDFTTPMLEVNARLQADDPTATVVGRDRVHPGHAGHFVMSYAFLKAQNMPALVSSIELDAHAKTTGPLINCNIDGQANFTDNALSFTCTENALPFPINNAQTKALAWVPFQQELNQQVFKVTGLEPGDYELSIDDTPVGTFSADALATGINLSDNHETPQYQQALRVSEACNKRIAVTNKLRLLVFMRHIIIRNQNPPIDQSDLEAVTKVVNDRAEKARDKSWYNYHKGQADNFLEYLPQEADLKASEEALMDQIWQTNRPESHHWQLKRINE
jgi:lysophospholipase L1-like esterase